MENLYCSSHNLFQQNISGVFTLLLSKEYPKAWWLPKLLNMFDNVALNPETQSALHQPLQITRAAMYT